VKSTDQSEADKMAKSIANYDQRVKQFRSESNSNYIEWKHKRQEMQIQYVYYYYFLSPLK